MGNVPITLLIGRESRVRVLVGEIVAVTTATTPLLTAVPVPDARQTRLPAPELQVSVAPAADRAGPAAALSEVMLAGEYASAHCIPAGAPVTALKERFIDTEPPLTVDPEARVKDGDWP